jgi:hypothetical protein
VLDFPNDQVQINPQTKELYYFQGNILNKGKAGINNPIYTFSKDLPGRLIFFTRIGNILCSLENSGEVYLSQNNGQSFTPVLTLSKPTSWAMNWGVEQIGNIILLGEYHLDNDSRANIYISKNEGQSFKHLLSIPKERHIHFIKKDPYSEYIYLTIGDDTKDVYRMSIQTLKPELLFKNSHLMSVGFHPDYVAFGSDKEYQNFINLLYRDGKTTTFDLTPPRDNMVYDFANLNGKMLSTNRLVANSKALENNYHCLWVVEASAAITNLESFYLSNVIDNTCYTGRTELTVKIRG